MAQPPKNSAGDIGYRLIDKRFSLDLGPQWIDRSIYRFEGPLEDGLQHYISVTIEGDLALTDLEAYADIQIKALASELQGFHELKRGPLLLTSRQPAYELVYQWCPAEDVELYQRHLWVLHTGTGYALTAAFTKRTWKLMGDAVDRILRSLRLPSADGGR